ncbi:hypothetical protein [Algoriphagus machipongonensis]|uniref:Uncharacterized protein n=1 Tax=Algoriphagus machipongonensis TaxID=388413 RepID=A3I331_9BACT|nr:hypothetical protein [Algoriphagus machipongonensis]EAZ79230.1 hypothetical protein ALPR1_14204 [Algoriphagus machipongonensis]
MEKDHLQSLLSNVFGHLKAENATEEKKWEEAIPQLARSLLIQDSSEIQAEPFSFESSELFFEERIPKKKIEKIKKVADKAPVIKKETAVKDGVRLKAFVRDVPIRTTQIKTSVPKWAAGAKVEKSIGPLTKVDGRMVMIDFFRVTKLIGIYQQNSNLPVILFKASFRQSKTTKVSRVKAQPIHVAKSYDVAQGSFYIRADMLASNAPKTRYVGLLVKDGKIDLTADPVLQGEKLILAATTKVEVSLNLDQTPAAPNAKKKHGKDAFEAKVQTPKALNFHFTGASKIQLKEVAPAQWSVYGEKASFSRSKKVPKYNSQLSRLLIPFECSKQQFSTEKQKSPMVSMKGTAEIENSWWAIPAAELDISEPLEVAGSGGFLQQLKEGLKFSWKELSGKNVKLENPFLLVDSGRIGITDLLSNGEGAFQEIGHWKDELNEHGTSVSLAFRKGSLFLYNSLAEGTEMIAVTANSTVNVDRPVQVNGLPVSIKTKNSALILAGSDAKNLIYLFDDNILWDNKLPFDKVPDFKSIAIALENALFTISPANGALVFGECSSDWKKIVKSQTFLVFGMLSYMPTLPDPYVANLGIFARQFGNAKKGFQGIRSWLVCQISQEPIDEELDKVEVKFYFGPNTNNNTSVTNAEVTGVAASSGAISQLASQPVMETLKSTAAASDNGLPPYEDQLVPFNRTYEQEFFALLDVSSNANQLGVSIGMPLRERVTTGVAHSLSEHEAVVTQTNGQLISVEGMEVIAPGAMTRLFMMPQVAWEPVLNMTPPGTGKPGDPPILYNYYPNDGGPTRFVNSHQERIALSPKPLVSFILDKYQKKETPVNAQFTLPFGLKALAELSHTNSRETIKPTLENIRPNFPNDLQGGIQIRATAGDYGKKFNSEPKKNDSPMFAGFTVQLANVLGANGAATGASTLGQSVTEIFNGEFFVNQGNPSQLTERGVPVSKIDFTGYGTSTFSKWLSPSAAIAQTSQSRFDVMLGRTGHEVIQVKSIVYPWGIRVVRTITLFRTSSGFVFRTDSGWQPESDGQFDFRYKYIDKTVAGDPEKEETPYELHPGTLRGLYNISNIKEDGTVADFVAKNNIGTNQDYINVFGEKVTNLGSPFDQEVKCVAVYFDADVSIENLVQGHKEGKTPAKKILGYVQLSPPGVPLTPVQLRQLLALQGGLIGGDVDCVMDVGGTGQMMQINRFDISPSEKPGNSSTDPIFVASTRGSVVLPKDGSWSMVQHETGSGEVTPLPPHIPIPLIRMGKWVKESVVSQTDVNNNLLRLAHPLEILRDPVAETINYGYLQSTSTQKALFLTPSYRKGISKLMSKTPPIFSDAYKLMNGSSIFPNVGDAYSNYGKAMALLDGVDEQGNKVKAFIENAAVDGGRKVLELMEITAKEEAGQVVEKGFKLLSGEANSALNKALAFDVPNFDPLYLVDMDSLKIYIEYKATQGQPGNKQYVDSKLNFDVDSFANDLADTWKSKVNNVGMVVDLGSFERLVTIKGNFDAGKGKETGYAGDKDNPGPLDGIPLPEVEFSPALEPVIELLQMLAALSTGDYGAVMRKGLQIAMSNAGEIWEYKFEAKKEIPLIRFPPEDSVYNSPQCPLRLEAGLALGVYFNAALKVTNDPKQLLPTAGGFVQFNGGLEVMCVTIGAATIYAVGSVEVKIACDTKIGPSLMMKFGFGANISVGLPVVGNVSVTYMVGCEMYADANVIEVTAFMLFKGHANLLGGIVSVTIYIEASGSVKRISSPERTECTASVTFGLDISICFIINISFEETWQESRQIA